MNLQSRTEGSQTVIKQQFGKEIERNVYRANLGVTSNGIISYSLKEGETLLVLKYAKVESYDSSGNVIDIQTKQSFTPTAVEVVKVAKDLAIIEEREEIKECYEQRLQDNFERVTRMKNGIKFLLPITGLSFLLALISLAFLFLVITGNLVNVDINILVLSCIAGFGWGVTGTYAMIKDFRRMR